LGTGQAKRPDQPGCCDLCRLSAARPSQGSTKNDQTSDVTLMLNPEKLVRIERDRQFLF
jgi:hypothetical protein